MKKAPKAKAKPKTKPPARRSAAPKVKAVDADRIKRVAIEYCLQHYPTLYTAGVPSRAKDDGNAWVVPVLLEDLDAGLSAEVGSLRLDPETGRVLGASSFTDVTTAGDKLYKESNHATAPAAAARSK